MLPYTPSLAPNSARASAVSPSGVLRLCAIRRYYLGRMSDIDSPNLPESLAPGDIDAFHRAFDAYLDPLRRFVYTYVTSWEIAEELVNDAFLQLWRRLQEGDSVRALKAYLYTAARNRAISHLRHRRVEARHMQAY